MRINEIKRIAEKCGYKYSESEYDHIFSKPYSNNSISINKTRKEEILILIPILCEKRDFNMIKAAIEFAETPIEDRMEKFYLKHKWMSIFGYNYLSMYILNGNYDFFDNTDDEKYKSQFTLKEIEKIKEEFDTDLADFYIVEV